MKDGDNNVNFPIPLDTEKQTKGQKWYQKNDMSPSSFSMVEWEVCGEIYIFHEDKVEIQDGHIRFGNHGYMRGFHELCLFAHFDHDDKHQMTNVRADGFSQTIVCTVGFKTVVIHIYPFQLERLRLLSEYVDIPELSTLIGTQMSINKSIKV